MYTVIELEDGAKKLLSQSASHQEKMEKKKYCLMTKDFQDLKEYY